MTDSILVISPDGLPSKDLPEIVTRPGPNAVFAAQEFFYGKIRNEHTRRAYQHEGDGVPRHHAFKEMPQRREMAAYRSPRTERAGLRRWRSQLIRHASCWPRSTRRMSSGCGIAPSWRFSSIPARAPGPSPSSGAATSTMPGSNGGRLHFNEKGGKSREIPVRADLWELVAAYIDAAGLRDAPKDTPLFQSALKRQRRLSGTRIHVNDICRMMKRRLKDIGFPLLYSPHSFRVTTITDLLERGVQLEDVRRLAGHADPRTTGLYDRRKRKITRNIVERISVLSESLLNHGPLIYKIRNGI